MLHKQVACEANGLRHYSALLTSIRLVCVLAALFLLGACAGRAFGSELDFATFRLGNGGNTALVIGGIQGDEPGGFSAATLLATRYEITTGSLWVVPNLNFPSILKRSRGLYGDMNRKFASLDAKDPEYGTVRRVQELISNPEVRLVLNLHDGSGYYRPVFEDKLKNPSRWGQSVIIDQADLPDGVFMGDLLNRARAASTEANAALAQPDHAIHVRNTRTADGDVEMEKSLSYYAARQNKAAFGIEASKEFPVHLRAYYHLLIVESLLRQAGISFRRDFDLSPAGIKKALGEHLGVAFAGNRIFLPLEDARPAIHLLPMPASDRPITSKPIMAVLPCADNASFLCIHYGNRKIARIRPDWREINEELDAVTAIVDGKIMLAPFGQILEVNDEVIIQPIDGFRVNAIGFDKGRRDEAGIPLRRKDFETRFSVDRAGRLFRVEVYKGDHIAGMFLLNFGKQLAQRQDLLPDSKGPESDLGF